MILPENLVDQNDFEYHLKPQWGAGHLPNPMKEKHIFPPHPPERAPGDKQGESTILTPVEAAAALIPVPLGDFIRG